MTYHRHADPWLLVACVLGVLALLLGWHAFMGALNQSVVSMFAGLVR